MLTCLRLKNFLDGSALDSMNCESPEETAYCIYRGDALRVLRNSRGEIPKAELNERLKWATSLKPQSIAISVTLRSLRKLASSALHFARRRDLIHVPTVVPCSLNIRWRYRGEMWCFCAIIAGERSGSANCSSMNDVKRRYRLVRGAILFDSLC